MTAAARPADAHVTRGANLERAGRRDASAAWELAIRATSAVRPAVRALALGSGALSRVLRSNVSSSMVHLLFEGFDSGGATELASCSVQS